MPSFCTGNQAEVIVKRNWIQYFLKLGREPKKAENHYSENLVGFNFHKFCKRFKRVHLRWFIFVTMIQCALYATAIFKTWMCIHDEFFKVSVSVTGVMNIIFIIIFIYFSTCHKPTEDVVSGMENVRVSSPNLEMEEESDQQQQQQGNSAAATPERISQKMVAQIKRHNTGSYVMKMLLGSGCCWLLNFVSVILVLLWNHQDCIQSTLISAQIFSVVCGVGILSYVLIYIIAVIFDHTISIKKFELNHGMFHMLQSGVLILTLAALSFVTIQELDSVKGLEELTSANKDYCRYLELDLLPNELSVRLDSISDIQLRVDELLVDENLKYGPPIQEDVPFEDILKLDKTSPCTFTVIEGDEGSGKTFLGKKMCHDFSVNPNSIFDKALKLVVYLQVTLVESSSDIKQAVLSELRKYFVTFNPRLQNVRDSEIESLVRKQDILIILDDSDVVTEGTKLVDEFVEASRYHFPKSKIVLLFNSTQVIERRISCRYRVKGVTRRNQHRIIDTITGEAACNGKVKKLISDSEPQFEEHLTPLLLGMLCHVCKTENIDEVSDNNSIMDKYINKLEKSCGINHSVFHNIVQIGYNLCIKGDKCTIREMELKSHFVQDSDVLFKVIRTCGILIDSNSRDPSLKNRLYLFRRTIILAGVVSMFNEMLTTKPLSNTQRVEFIESYLRHADTIQLGIYITEDDPMVCFYGTVYQLIFCINDGSTLEGGRMLTQHEVDYKYKKLVANPSYSLINSVENFVRVNKFYQSLNKIVLLDFKEFFQTCEAPDHPVVYDYKRYKWNEAFFRLSKSCKATCSTENILVYAIDTSKQDVLEVIHSKYKKHLDLTCDGSASSLDIKKAFNDWIRYIQKHQAKIVYFSLEQKNDPTRTVPESYLQFTYENNEVFLAFYQFMNAGIVKIYNSKSHPSFAEMPEEFSTSLNKLKDKFPNSVYGSRSFYKDK